MGRPASASAARVRDDGRQSAAARLLDDRETLPVQDFGARDPTAAELTTQFGAKSFGHANTDHVKRHAPPPPAYLKTHLMSRIAETDPFK